MLDPVEQRVLGVLMEKELAVPDSYPMTEATLLAGCNQKSNRDPEMALESHDLHMALQSLREKQLVIRVDGSSRSAKYRHDVDTMLGLDQGQRAVLCELLIRGPQAPGALKPRVSRMDYHANPHEILDLLEALAARGGTKLVEQQPKRPRERDQRWGHLLGPREDEGEEGPPAATVPSPVAEPTAPISAAQPSPTPAATVDPELASRVELLEKQVTSLSEEMFRLRRILKQLAPDEF